MVPILSLRSLLLFCYSLVDSWSFLSTFAILSLFQQIFTELLTHAKYVHTPQGQKMNKVAFLPSENSQSSDRYVWKVVVQ